MLAIGKIKEAERLLSQGNLSQRRIAKEVGISRATVGAIASGTRPDYEAMRLARAADNQPLGPLARRPDCGGMAFMPCRLCRVRKKKEIERERLASFRRQAREQALKRLLAAVWRASQDREQALQRGTYLPPSAARGVSDCK